MADATKSAKGGGSEKGQSRIRRESTQIAGSAQTGIAVAAFVATLAVVYLLQNVAGLGTVPTLLIGIVVLVVLVFGGVAALAGRRRASIGRDAEATCKPILDRYRRSGNVAQLVSDYDGWARGEHDQALVLEFTQATIDALVEGGHEKQARRQLRVLHDAIGNDPRGLEDFEKYRADCERRLKAARREAHRSRG